MIIPFNFFEHLDELKVLFTPHWEEIASNKHSRTLNVDYEYYKQLDDLGALLCIGAFKDNAIVGYSINAIVKDAHDCTKIICNNDALYVKPEFRTGSIGIKLIKETEKLAKERNCYGVIWHAKPGSPLDHLLEKIGYYVKDLLYMKEV